MGSVLLCIALFGFIQWLWSCRVTGIDEVVDHLLWGGMGCHSEPRQKWMDESENYGSLEEITFDELKSVLSG